MADTFWVSTSGSNSDDGLSYSTAWETINHALNTLDGMVVPTMSIGDTLNIVNDGTHILSSVVNTNLVGGAIVGTDWEDGNWGFKIRGSDADGNAALATIQIPNSAGQYSLLQPQNGSGYFLIEGLRFVEASGADGAAGVNVQLMRVGSSANDPAIMVRYCSFEFGDSQAPVGNRWIITKVAEPGAMLVDHCYIKNAHIAIGRGGGPAVPSDDGFSFTDNVYVMDQDGIFTASGGISEGALVAGSTYEVDRNTIAVLVTNTATKINGIPIVSQINAAASNGTGTCQDNLYFVGTKGDGSAILTEPTIPVPFGYQSAHEYAFNTSTVDYNAFLIAPECTGSEAGGFPYTDPFDTGGNYKTNDISAITYDATEVFEDITAAYSWVVGSYTLDIDYDLRPILTTVMTGASDGGPMGALPTANNPPTASNLTYSVTMGRTLSATAGDGLLSTAVDLDGDTITVTNLGTPARGTITGYNINTGAFTYVPDGLYVGTDSFTFYVEDPFDVSPAYTASISITNAPAPTYSITNLIDVEPFFRPTLRVTTEIRYKSKKNRLKFKDMANYTEKLVWDESTHRVINLDTNTTSQITLGGVATAEYLMVETDTPINVSINDTSRYWTVNKVVAVAITSATTVYIQNAGADVAQVILSVVD